MTESRSEKAGAKETILSSIRSSLAVSRPFDAEHQAHHRPDLPASRPRAISLTRDELKQNFRSSLDLVGAECRIAAGKQEAAAEVSRILEHHAARRIAVSDSVLVNSLLPVTAASDILRNASPEELFSCDIGITGAQFGIAETGTLVLESDRESHRLTSLVPPVHLCILRAHDIRQSLGEVLEMLSRDLSRTVTFITGASRTSDIELTLAIGVHGPRELHVIIVDE